MQQRRYISAALDGNSLSICLSSLIGTGDATDLTALRPLELDDDAEVIIVFSPRHFQPRLAPLSRSVSLGFLGTAELIQRGAGPRADIIMTMKTFATRTDDNCGKLLFVHRFSSTNSALASDNSRF